MWSKFFRRVRHAAFRQGGFAAFAVALSLLSMRPAGAAPWNVETVDVPGDVGRYTSCKVAANGDVHVAYQDAGNSLLKYGKKTTYWTLAVADPTPSRGLGASLALTTSGEPRISHATPGALYYSTKSGVTWSTEYVGQFSIWGGGNTSLVLAAGNVPRLAFQQEGPNSIDDRPYCVEKPGAQWLGAIMDNTIGYISTGYHVSQVLDQAGESHASFQGFYSFCGCALVYATRAMSGPTIYWTHEYVTTSGGVTGTSLAFDGGNQPVIVYVEGYPSGGVLKFARKQGGVWVFENVDLSGSNMQDPSLAIDASGACHVSYYDGVNGDLKYALRSPGGVWSISVVDAVNNVGQYTSLSLDASGRPHVTYYDVTNGNLKHAWQDAVNCASGGCFPAPSQMTGWWSFDEITGAAINLAGPSTGTNGTLTGNATRVAAGKVQKGLQCLGGADGVTIATNPLFDVGTGNFSLDAWINAPPSGPTVRIIADKRTFLNASAQGYSFFLFNGMASVQLADPSGYDNFISSSPNVADGLWHHVAFTVNRGYPSGGRIYVDGALIHTFDPTGRPGSLDTTAPMFLAQESANGYGSYLAGTLDEVEFWKRELSAAAVVGIWQAGTAGKCKETCTVPSIVTFPTASGSLPAQAQIWNFTSTTQTYAWTLAPMPLSGTCSYPASGPIANNTVTISAGSSATINYTIPYPTGMPAGTQACYQFTVTNLSLGGACFATIGHIALAQQLWTLSEVLQVLVTGTARVIDVPVSNPQGTPATVLYKLAERASDGDLENVVLGINGMRPGGAVEGIVTFSGDETVSIPVTLEITAHDPFAVHDLVLSVLSSDGTGAETEVAVWPLVTAPDGATGVAPPALDAPLSGVSVHASSLRGTADIAFTLREAGPVTLEILNVTGRLIRRVPPVAFAAGRHHAAWDGHDAQGRAASAGLYIVCVHAGEQVRSARFLSLR